MQQNKTKQPVKAKSPYRAKAKPRRTLSEKNLGRFMRDEDNATVYIGNLNYARDEVEIKELFKPFGVVNYVRLIKDRETEKSKGIAFVQMPDKKAADFAISKLNGSIVDDRTLKVSLAIDSPKAKLKAAKAARKPKPTVPELADEKIITQAAPREKKPKGLQVLFDYLGK